MIFKKEERTIDCNGIAPFKVHASFVQNYREYPTELPQSHVHPECEIYVNLSGNVSFMVENHIYPIIPGSVIITRPYEYHHCVYHNSEPHNHFWILFSANGNERLFPRFYERELGSGNLLLFSNDDRDQLESLCETLVAPTASELETYSAFFRLMELFEQTEVTESNFSLYPSDVMHCLDYIGKHFATPISIQDVAKEVHVSINTLERHFFKTLHMTPSEYLRKKRLANAAELLYSGRNVTEACQESGFADYSKFISLFKKYYGMTPLKYQKKNRNI